jgi:hypothetical protein
MGLMVAPQTADHHPMVPRPIARLAAAAAAVALVAACSGGDDPEPVATGGGLELASTTTEQPVITEPRRTTTTTSTTTTSTTTTSTTTTTTAPAPVVPDADALAAALPGSDALAAGEWTGSTAPAAATKAPAPLCDGSDAATPLAPIVYEGAADGGATARYERPDQSTRVLLTVAPLADAEPRMAEALAAVATCAAGSSPVNVLAWTPIGDGSVAYSRSETGPVGDAQTPGGQTAAWALARVGPLVVTLNVQSFWAEGQELAPAPTEAELQSYLKAAVAAVRPLTTPASG